MNLWELGPPERRTPAENHTTLLISWWCTGCALFLIGLRVFGRLSRTGKLFSEDKIMACAIIPLMIRMAFVHVVLIYGTNNTTFDGISEEAVHRRVIGSKMVLGARIFYAMFIWVSKLTVSEFLKRLTTATWNRTYEIVFQGIRVFLGLTFIGVVVGTLAECHPFNHYWQVVPDPGPSCRNGFSQLFTMSICDIVTDIVLIAFPFVVVMRSGMPMKKKILTVCLYSLGAILIAIVAYRVPAIVEARGRQQRRSLWASLEILASTAAANAVIIGSFVRDKGIKKQRYRPETARTASSTEEPALNRNLARKHWGNDSDEDLFRSCGGRMDSVTDQYGAQPVRDLPRISEPHQHPYEDIEDRYEYTGKGKGPMDRHASESLPMQDPGGLLYKSDDSPTSSQHLGDGSFAHDFASASSIRDVSPSSSAEMRAETTRAGAQEAHRHRQALPPNGRPTGPGSEMDLQDPGGLLR